MKNKILLVEDDKQIREVIADYFSAQQEDEITLVSAFDGNEGLAQIVEAQFDLVILDNMLPGIDGFTLCKEIRRNSIVPIIFLSARGQEEDKIRGYMLGCDDYMVKPFLLSVLYAKVKALVKRAKGMVLSPVIQVSGIELNPGEGTVKVEEKEIELAPKEYELLKYLMEHRNQIISRENLLIHIWGYDFEGTDRVVDNHIKKLRKILGSGGKYIRTVIKKGYKMEERERA